MEFQHIWAVTLRHTRLVLRDMNLIMVTLYWPLLDVLIWGFLGAWLQQLQSNNHNYELVLLLSILLWQTVSRTACWLAASLDEEIQAGNLVNLFTFPLRISEWIAGVTLFSFLLSLVTAIYCIGLMIYFYSVSFFYMLTLFCMFAAPLFISGIWIGFLGLQVLISCGKRARELMYIFAWAAAPFCSAFYPREVLPHWAQVINSLLPMSYVFEGMRSYLLHGTNPWPSVLTGLALAVAYATLAIVSFIYLFNKSKNKGLARLSD